MIVPFWSWNLSDTTHVRPHTKFQLVWAINIVFTRGGHNVPPPLTQMCSWDPLTIRVKERSLKGTVKFCEGSLTLVQAMLRIALRAIYAILVTIIIFTIITVPRSVTTCVPTSLTSPCGAAQSTTTQSSPASPARAGDH